MKTDLLIIGGGLAGLTAAYEVLKAEPGRRITILRPGAGSSPYVHGFNMPLNPQDSTELFIQDTEASGRGQGNAALVEELCRGSLELLPFFDELGLDFNREADGSYQQLRPLGASCPRVISIGNDAAMGFAMHRSASASAFVGCILMTTRWSPRKYRISPAAG